MVSRVCLRWLVCSQWLVALTGVCGAQGGNPPTLRISARIVVLDVSVRDAEGRPVTDLTANDFHVYEDHDLQAIRNFEPPSAHRMVGAGPDGETVVHTSADLVKIGQAPITILVLDELNMPFGEEVYARDQVAKWLHAQPAVLAQPTMVVAVTYKDLRVLVDTTQDRDRMAAVLGKHVATTPWRSYNAGTIGGTAGDLMAESLGALEQIAQAMRGVPGRKNLVWVGDGFPSVQPTDVTVTAADAVKAQLRRLSASMLQSRIVLTILGPTIKPPNRPTNIETFSDSMGGTMTGSNTGAASGSVGVGGLGQASTVPLGGSLDFSDLAAPTGGKAYRGRNDMDRELAETLSAGTVYYTMTYTPTNSSEAEQKYRKIRVDVLRSGLTLQTRDGYYPPAHHEPGTAVPMPSKQQLAFDLYGAANSTLPYTDLHVVPARTDATHWTLNIRAAEMGWEEKQGGGLEAKSVVLAACFDRKGRIIGRTFDAVGSDTDSSEAQLLGRDTVLHVNLTEPAGTARIRFVVRDSNSGRVGAADAMP